MSAESRQLPQSNIGRLLAIKTADAKNTAMGVASFLTTATKTRLVSINTSYKSRYDAIALKKHDMVVLTAQKNSYANAAAMINSHFIQVFNLAVTRSIFVKEDRTFYKLDVSDASVPAMGTDEEILQVASDLMKGEADRITAGGTPMAMPDIAEVTTAYTNLNGVVMPHSTAVDAYDNALESLDALNTEADAVIKKVWDEVETFYNEEDAPSQRQNARQWGVIYILQGSLKTISGKVSDAANNLGISDITVRLLNGNKTAVTDKDGNYSLTTTLMNEQHMTAAGDLFEDYDEVITLTENENLTWDIMMVSAT